MALRELLLPWDAQPQEAVRPSDQFDGLSTLVTLWDLRDAARSESVAVTGTRLTVTRWGLARGFGSTLGGGTTDRVQTSATARQRQTFVVVGVRNGPGGGGYGRYFQSGTTGIAPCEVLFNSIEGTTAFQRLSGNIARFTWAYPDIGVPFCTVISYDASAAGWKPTVATNGVAQSVTTTSPPTSAGGNVTGAIIVGNREAGDRAWDGHWLLFAEIDRACSRSECIDLSANPWQLFEPRRIWVPVSAGGTAHDGTGALSSDAATISGTAAHFTLHASSGALSSDASTIAGSANHIVVHPSSGALSSQDATLAGTALRYRQFSATGALDSASATIAGDAAHTTTGTFSATGALSAQDGTIAGTATHLTLHTATGAIQASDSTITGTAARLGTHDATGSLSADLASITGTVLHTGDGAEVVPLRTGGHAFMRERFAQARKRLALQRILSYLTEEEPAEETKRIIRAVKAGKPIQDKKPPVVMAEVSAEKIAEKLIPSRVADLAEIPDIDMQAVIKKAIRLAQERDDEDVLLLL